jgi:hypothetical protein
VTFVVPPSSPYPETIYVFHGSSTPVTGPALVTRDPREFDLFITGKDGRLYHKMFDEYGSYRWSPSIRFCDLGGNSDLKIPPTVTSWPGGVDISLVGGKNTLSRAYHKRWKTSDDPTFLEFELLPIWACITPIAAVVKNIEVLGE